MGEIRTEQRGRVLVATLHNPPHALMDQGIVRDLSALVVRATEDDGVGAVVLAGSHPTRFIAHYDVAELLEAARTSPPVGPRAARASLRAAEAARRMGRVADALQRTPAAGLLAIAHFHATLLGMNRSGAVFVAALNGSALGGGCELALACDVRLMAAGEHAIGQPEILLGFPPGGGGSQRLVRMLGSARALRLVLEGAQLDPEQAAAIGLVDEVAAHDDVLDRAVEVAQRLGNRIKAGVAASKRAVYEGGSLPLSAGLRREAAEFSAALGAPEARAAMTAYLDAFERTGELPAYDLEWREGVLERGRVG
jgi:enoyl-CoA hydratase